MDVERTFLEDNVDEEIYIELPDQEVPGVHGNADEDVAQNKVSSAECGGKVVRESLKTLELDACLTVPCLLGQSWAWCYRWCYISRVRYTKINFEEKNGIDKKQLSFSIIIEMNFAIIIQNNYLKNCRKQQELNQYFWKMIIISSPRLDLTRKCIRICLSFQYEIDRCLIGIINISWRKNYRIDLRDDVKDIRWTR